MTNERSDQCDGRDARGRWTKGTTGNPNGRPPKIPDLDMADVYNFSHFLTEIVIGGEKQLMTRHEIVLLKIFDSALKGRVSNQRYLIQKFEEAQMAKEYLELWLERWEMRMNQDPSSVPMEVLHLVRAVRHSQGVRRSMIRTRNDEKWKRK